MIVNVANEQSALLISVDQVQKLVQQTLSYAKERCDEISVHFVDTPTISQLHHQFFNDPSTTDCISFPIDESDEEGEYRLLGEIFVCPETALAFVKKNGGNAYEEISLYIVHGLLHLMGYDDIEEEEIAEMRKKEAEHMEHLRSLSLLLV